MNARLRWGVGMTALAALAVSSGCVIAFPLVDGGGSFLELWLLTVPPAVVASVASAWWCLRRQAFIRRAPWMQSLIVTVLALLAYAVLLVFWMFFRTLLDSGFDVFRQDAESLTVLLAVASIGTAFAVLMGALPAYVIEYWIFKTMRRRWPPQQYTTSAAESVA